MNTENTMPSELYKAAAENIAELTRNPRKTPRLREEAQKLEKACHQLVEENCMINASDVWQAMLNYYSRQLPRYTVTRWGAVYEETEAERLQTWINAMNRLLYATQVEKLAFITLQISWNRNPTWGWNPTCRASWNSYHGTGRASGCGYDKLSAAVNKALESIGMTRFLIEHYHEVKDLYGICTYDGLPHLDIGGKGINELEKILQAAGWKNADYNARTYYKGDFVEAHYSKD